MRALEPAAGIRVVATPAALQKARWSGKDVVVLRIAPDEVIAIGAMGADVDDPDAIVEAESGFSVARLGPEFVTLAAHTDWPIPDEPGAFAQGKIAGVPVKLLIGEPTFLVVQTAYADELRDRLRW